MSKSNVFEIFPVHPLKIWATKRKIHLKKLAEDLNTTYLTIYRINEYRQKPSPKLAKKIHEITGIPILHLLYPEDYLKENKKSERIA